MKHKVKVNVPVESRGLFGQKKVQYKKCTLEVDGKTYREMKKNLKNQPYSLEEMMFYDDIIFDEF